MELAFVARSVMRFWWVVVAGVLVGGVLGSLATSLSEPLYEAEGSILLVPATQSAQGATVTDRFVQNQMELLGSESVAQEVADRVGETSSQVVLDSATFEQAPGSDVVLVTVASPTAEGAKRVVDAYIDAYFDVIDEQRSESLGPALDAIEVQVADVEERLTELDTEIEGVLAPFVSAAREGGLNRPVIPTLDQVAPTLATEREVLIDQYSELLRSRNDLLARSVGAESAAQVVQYAATPSEPIARSSMVFALAGAIAGGMAGALAAAAVARVSPRVLDGEEVEQTLGLPIAGALPWDRHLGELDAMLGQRLPESVRGAVSEICVRTETQAPAESGLVVVVAGAQQPAGVTTLCSALARHFADGGRSVVLVDANGSDRRLTEAWGAEQSEVVALMAGASTAPRPKEIARGVAIAGLGRGGETPQFRPQDAEALVSAVRSAFDVAVIDGGSLLGSSTTARLAQLADALILAVPQREQSRRSLDVVSDQYRSLSVAMLPVVTSPNRPRARLFGVGPTDETLVGEERSTSRASV